MVGRATTHEWCRPSHRAPRRATTHELGRPSLRAQCGAGRPHECVVATTRNWIGIASLKSTPPSSESTSLCTRDDVTMVHECKQSTTTSRNHVKKNFQVNTFHDDFKAWMDFYRHCVCLWSYLKYTFSFYKVKLWQSNRGIPVAIVMLSNLHNYPWVVLLQRTAFKWWCHGNRGYLLAEKGIQ